MRAPQVAAAATKHAAIGGGVRPASNHVRGPDRPHGYDAAELEAETVAARVAAGAPAGSIASLRGQPQAPAGPRRQQAAETALREGAGQPLAPSLRTDLERSFQQDFSHVRV